MREKQETIIIFRAACVAGVVASAAVTAGGAFLDLVTPLYDAEAAPVLPGAALLALQGLPAFIALFAMFGATAHFSLKQRGLTNEIHYILASMAAIYSVFVAASFLVGPGDGPMMALSGGVPISLVLGFPLGMNFRRLVVMPRPEPYRRFDVGASYYARLNH